MLDQWIIKLGAQPWNRRGKYRLYKLLDRCVGTVRGVTPLGVRLEFRPTDVTCYHYFRPGRESQLLALIDELPAEGIFVDVGANAGNYSIIAARRVGASGRVIAFEAARETYARLVRHLSLNQADNVIPLNAAVGAEEGLATMTICENSGLSHLGKMERPNFEKTERVPLVSLDRFLPALTEGRKIDLLKIDVEGAELSVLRGAEWLFQSGAIKKLHLELIPGHLARFGNRPEEVYQFMADHGYRRAEGVTGAENAVFERADQAALT